MTAPAIITVLEGPDGAGKSHAADLRAQKEFAATGKPARRVHNGPPAEGLTRRQLFAVYLNQLERAVRFRDLGISTIIDRSWPSEVVYGALYRGGSLLSKRQVRKLERYAAKHDIVTVYLDTTLYLRLGRLAARGESADMLDAAVLGIEYDRYFQSYPGWIKASSSLA